MLGKVTLTNATGPMRASQPPGIPNSCSYCKSSIVSSWKLGVLFHSDVSTLAIGNQ
jgi:hypothetical protein